MLYTLCAATRLIFTILFILLCVQLTAKAEQRQTKINKTIWKSTRRFSYWTVYSCFLSLCSRFFWSLFVQPLFFFSASCQSRATFYAFWLAKWAPWVLILLLEFTASSLVVWLCPSAFGCFSGGLVACVGPLCASWPVNVPLECPFPCQRGCSRCVVVHISGTTDFVTH